jgi:ATP-dependent DNA helicase DinG
VAALSIDEFLGPSGPVARRLEGYEARPQQIAMARAVARAIDSNGRLLVEAGTGVGKSFAYLLPAIARILEKKQRVVVATNTIALQEQLIEKDVPLLRAVIPGEFTAVLVKGRGNYVSLRRLKLASERQSRLLPDDNARHALHQVEDWAIETRDGTLSTLPQLKRPEVWDFVRSDAHNCMGRKCPTYDKCFYQAARRRMENGDLLICNHALFFADLALRAGGVSLLPNYDHVILDEAHAIEDVAADHFGFSVSEAGVHHLLRLLYRPRNHVGFLTTLKVEAGAEALCDGAIELVNEASAAAEALFGDLHRWQLNHPRGNGEIADRSIVANPLTPALKELASRLALLKKKAKAEADAFEIASYLERARALAGELETILEQKAADSVYWMELHESERYRRERPRVELRSAPIEVGPILRDQLFSREISIIMTSATLAAARRDFSHVTQRLGCEAAETLQLGSPFDYARQMELFIERRMPDPQSPEFLDALCPRILEHVVATDGGAFVLFTSFSLLDQAAARMREELARRGFPVLVHGADGPRGMMLKRFRDDRRSVLFGTTSFWQGVDVRGEGLRNVIITRLPFDVPDRPLIRARLERIRERGGNPFMEDQVPRAVIRFKQGFGRLIRSTTDRGRVVVLDPRIATKSYGRIFLDALPEGVGPRLSQREDVFADECDVPEPRFVPDQ